MKKIFYALTLALAVGLAGSAFAKHECKDCKAQTKGGYMQDISKMPSSTVQAVMTMPDETLVMLQGNISKRVNKSTYVFTDNTGEIMVEIDSDAWNGQNVSPTDTITIIGEIDQNSDGTTIEVEQIMLQPQTNAMQ